MTDVPLNYRVNYFDRRNGLYFDRFGNEWTFLEEVMNIAHCRSLCRQYGVYFFEQKKRQTWSAMCSQLKFFRKSNGCQGFDCPYRLLFVRPKNRLKQQTVENFGCIFQRGKHCHPFIPGINTY